MVSVIIATLCVTFADFLSFKSIQISHLQIYATNKITIGLENRWSPTVLGFPYHQQAPVPCGHQRWLFLWVWTPSMSQMVDWPLWPLINVWYQKHRTINQNHMEVGQVLSPLCGFVSWFFYMWVRVKATATMKQSAQSTLSLVCLVTAELPLSIWVLAGCWDLYSGYHDRDGWELGSFPKASQKRWGEHGSRMAQDRSPSVSREWGTGLHLHQGQTTGPASIHARISKMYQWVRVLASKPDWVWFQGTTLWKERTDSLADLWPLSACTHSTHTHTYKNKMDE